MKTLKFYDEACSTQMIMPDEPHYDHIEELGKRITFLTSEEVEKLLSYLQDHASEFVVKLNKAIKHEQEQSNL